LNEADVKARALEAPIAAGRELWGFPKKLGSPKLTVETDTLLGVLHSSPARTF